MGLERPHIRRAIASAFLGPWKPDPRPKATTVNDRKRNGENPESPELAPLLDTHIFTVVKFCFLFEK